MPLLSVVITLIVVGILLGFVNKYGREWIAASMLKLINAVVVIAVILWLLSVFGLWQGIPSLRIGR